MDVCNVHDCAFDNGVCPACEIQKQWDEEVAELQEEIKDLEKQNMEAEEKINALVKAAREVLEKSWDFIESHKIRANLVGLEQAYRPFWRTDGD